ncbi:hypothetical protein UAJ10_26200 [Nitrospirillum sp. BR 11164]|uniref:hypothetical protein n=1 Tax=Nitrospirillum sp. BR 11164 TaxID=3104324 RepID=UPI002AFFE279|nr:hypothetical protein [Nitrospirillum sp. BR 11164]MEA1652489.1 hypothetical protein [Nitrospirillum sp. BR 11164]
MRRWEPSKKVWRSPVLNALRNLLSITVVLLLLVPLTDLAMQVLPPVIGALPPLLVGLVFLAFMGQVLAAAIRHARLHGIALPKTGIGASSRSLTPPGPDSPWPVAASLTREIAP